MDDNRLILFEEYDLKATNDSSKIEPNAGLGCLGIGLGCLGIGGGCGVWCVGLGCGGYCDSTWD